MSFIFTFSLFSGFQAWF